jgi:hypothetical protein
VEKCFKPRASLSSGETEFSVRIVVPRSGLEADTSRIQIRNVATWLKASLLAESTQDRMRWKNIYEWVSGKDEKRSDRYHFQVAVATFAWRNPLCTFLFFSAGIRSGSLQNMKQVCSTSSPQDPAACQSLNNSESSIPISRKNLHVRVVWSPSSDQIVFYFI